MHFQADTYEDKHAINVYKVAFEVTVVWRICHKITGRKNGGVEEEDG